MDFIDTGALALETTDRRQCVVQLAEAWKSIDRAGWLFADMLADAVRRFGRGILPDIAQERHGSIHTLENILSTWRNPAAQLAQSLELTLGHVDVVAGIASTNFEQAEDYLRTAAENALSVPKFRQFLHTSSPTVTHTVPTSGSDGLPDNPPFADEHSVLYVESAESWHRPFDVVIRPTMTVDEIVTALRLIDREVLRRVTKQLADEFSVEWM